MFSNDALGLAVGQARYGAFLDADGLMVDDGTVFNTGGGHCWVMTNGKDHDGYFGEAFKDLDAEFEWIARDAAPRRDRASLARGRAEAHRRRRRCAALLRFLPDPVKVAGVEVFLSRTGFGGELGFELFLTDPADAEELWDAVVEAGATPFGAEAIEPARIEAGLIVTDYDYEAHQRTPFDFNLDRFVRLDAPGDFLGKEKLGEVAANPPNRFVTPDTTPRPCPSTVPRSRRTARRSACSRARPTARGSARSASR